MPEPNGYGKSHDVKEFKNFLYDIKTYFKAVKVTEHDQVDMAAMFLNVDVNLWWRMHVAEDQIAREPWIDTWAALKKELREQFLPCNTSWVVCEAMKKLRQMGLTRDYV